MSVKTDIDLVINDKERNINFIFLWSAAWQTTSYLHNNN